MKKNECTMYEFAGDKVIKHVVKIDDNKGKRITNLLLTGVTTVLLGTTTFVVAMNPYRVPRLFDNYYYQNKYSTIADSVDNNENLDSYIKERVNKYASKFIEDYKDYLDYDLLCSVFNNLRIIYEIDNQSEYGETGLMKGYYNSFNFIEGSYNTIILFTDDESVLAHELFHVISRYSNFELNEGMAELLKCESNNLTSSSYGPMMFHIKMLSEIIDKECLIKDFLGCTDISTKKALDNTGAFDSIREVGLFIDAIQKENEAINNFITTRERKDLEDIQDSERIISEGYEKIFNKMGKSYPEYYYFYEILVDNYNSNDVSNYYMYVDNTNIFYNNGKDLDISVKTVLSSKQYSMGN